MLIRCRVLALALVLSACVNTSTSNTPPGPIPALRFAELTVSGGVAGVDRCVRIDAAGTLNLWDRRAGLTCHRPLSDEERVAFKAALEDFWRQVDSDERHAGPGHCADCIYYQLVVHDRGKRFSTAFTGREDKNEIFGWALSRLLVRQLQQFGGCDRSP